MTKIAVVGAGMAGLACAGRLIAKGFEVVVIDKGRGSGGRMATRRVSTSLGEVSFDHGAQYLTVRDEGFRALAARWIETGALAPWPVAGDDAYVGVPAMNAPLKRMADGLDVRWSTRVQKVERHKTGWRLLLEPGDGAAPAALHGYDQLILALPAEQSAELLEPVAPTLAALARATPTAPCWTAMAAFSQRLETPVEIMRSDGVIGWAARNSGKPGRSGPEAWVIQGSPDWSLKNLENDPAAVANALLEAFSRLAGITAPDPALLLAHRWRFARSGSFGAPFLLDEGLNLGVCGDWLLGARVECAFRSGNALAEALILHAEA